MGSPEASSTVSSEARIAVIAKPIRQNATNKFRVFIFRTPSIDFIIFCRTIDKFSAERTPKFILTEYLEKGIVVKNRSFSKNTC
jgi:hypothetical protein